MVPTRAHHGNVAFVAVWQSPFALVPRKAWSAAVPRPEMPIWDGTAALWAGESAQEWTQRLKAAFGESAPYWDQAGLMWGDYDKHCLEFSTEDGDIAQLKLRIDLRSDDIGIVERLLSFARENELLLLTGEGEPIDPELSCVGAALRNSSAARFVKDPVASLESLSKANIT